MKKYPFHEKKMHWHDWQSYVENIGGHSSALIVSKILNDQDSDDDVPYLDAYSVAS